MAEIRELKGPADLDLLRRFVDECFKPSFPGDDERDVEDYFHRAQRGEFGADVPHVVVATVGDVPVAGCLGVYLAEPNAGVVEYVVVRESHRGGSGLVTPLYDVCIQAFAEDASRRGLELGMVFDEMEDPFRTPLPTWTRVDRFKRVKMAQNSGYKMLDFPYVERHLELPGQTGVHTLMLMAVPHSGELGDSVPARLVRTFVQAYFQWDGRDESEGPTSYQGVLRSILDYLPDSDEPVPLFDLSDYVCSDESKAPIDVEVHDDPGHVWTIRLRGAPGCAARASFFSTPSVGFGRQLVVPATFDTRAVAYLCSRIEKQMIQDGNLSLGWYVRCASAAERDALVAHRVGFHALDVPGFWVYKPYGRPHRTPRLPMAEFLASMQQIGESGAWASLAGLDSVPVHTV